MGKESILTRLCHLVSQNDPEVQTAALKVLGELNRCTSEIEETLKTALDSNNKNIHLYAIEALCKLRLGGSLPSIIKLLSQDEVLQKKCSRFLGLFGKSLLAYFIQHKHSFTPELKKTFLEAFKDLDTAEAFLILYQSASSETPELAPLIWDTLWKKIKTVSPSPASTVSPALASLLQQVTQDLRTLASSSHPETTLSIPIEALLTTARHLPQQQNILLLIKLLKHKHPTVVLHTSLILVDIFRDEALRGKKKALYGQFLERLYSSLPLFPADHPLYAELVDNIGQIPPTDAVHKPLFHFLKSPHLFLNRFAVRLIASFSSPPLLAALVQTLDDPAFPLYEETVTLLKQQKNLGEILLPELKRVRSLSAAQALTDIIKSYHVLWSKKQQEEFLQEALSLLRKFLQTQDPARQKFQNVLFNFYLDLVSSLHPEHVREVLLLEGQKLKKARKFLEAEHYFKPLQKPVLTTAETSYEYAVVKLAQKEINTEYMDKTLTYSLYVFSELLKIPKFELVRRLKQEKSILNPAHYYYLATFFLEKGVLERAFAREILQWLKDVVTKGKMAKLIRDKLQLGS